MNEDLSLAFRPVKPPRDSNAPGIFTKAHLLDGRLCFSLLKSVKHGTTARLGHFSRRPAYLADVTMRVINDDICMSAYMWPLSDLKPSKQIMVTFDWSGHGVLRTRGATHAQRMR